MADAPARNISFELTEAFTATGPTVALASGQAVVYYRVAITEERSGGASQHNGPPSSCRRSR